MTFVEDETGKFVRFAGSREELLYSDLPAHPLSAEETVRARKLFADRGVTAEETDEGPFFGMWLERDSHAAAAKAWRVLTEVYGFTEESLIVESRG